MFQKSANGQTSTKLLDLEIMIAIMNDQYFIDKNLTGHSPPSLYFWFIDANIPHFFRLKRLQTVLSNTIFIFLISKFLLI